MKCSKKCERCKKYKSLYLKQETKNDELIEILEKLSETQKIILEYIGSQKVVGVESEKKRC
jgi:hypothetical protein|tara:strand:+ start:772 stop:954 length:183 start_codon:yes stop_codon:yes gene_type:complete